MKQVKKVLSFALALILLVTACYTNGLGVSAGVNANGETETDVTRVYSGHNEEIVTFVLSESDYSQSTKWLGTRSEEYNFWTNIQVYTSETEYVTLKDAHTNQKYYRIWDRANTLSIQLKEDTYNAATKIVIPAGTVFPSYAYDSDDSATKGGYVTTQELEFIKPVNLVPEKFGQGTPWIKTIPATEEKTNVKNIHARGGNKLLFFLSDEDYTGKGATVSATLNRIKEYDQLLDKIEIYTSDTDFTTLAEARDTTSTVFYNVWNEQGSIAFDLKSGWDATKISKVVVKAGCQFPSYEYTEKSAPVKTAYTVKADTTFTRNSIINGNECTSWTRKAAPVDTPSGISRVHLRTADAKLLIFPTVSDYSNASATTGVTLSKIKEYNLLDNVVLYKSDAEFKTLRDLCTAETDNYYNIWGESPCIALDMDNAWNGTTVKKIEFKAGCQFPSYAYTHQGSMDNVAYTLQEDLVYVTNTSTQDNTDWTLVDNPTDTTVAGVKSGHNNSIVTFTLSNSDYVKQEDIQYDTTAYNFWDEIKLYTSDSEPTSLKDAYTNGKQAYLNMWGIANSVSIEIDSGIYEKLVSIEIPAGTVFPSRAYNSGASQKKGGFKTTTDITFVKPEGADETQNVGYNWEVDEEPTDVETTIAGIQVRSKKLIILLDKTDYPADVSTEGLQKNLKDYNILDSIVLYDNNGNQTTLNKAHSGNSFYNIWETRNSIAFELKDDCGWDGTTIKRVTIQTGAQFPSYNYTNGSGVWKSYTLQKEITFVTNTPATDNTNWSEYYEPVVNKTEIKNIHVRDGFVLLFLSNHDYAKVAATTPIGSKWSVYNLLDNITITTKDATNKLSNILPEKDEDKQAFYNIFGEIGAVGIKMRDGYNGTTIKKVAIKKGAEFPAYDYTDGGAKAITSYVTEKDYVFNTGNTTATNNTEWTKVTPYSSATDITDVSVSGSKLTFTLSENDYVAGAVGSNHTDFDYWNKVKVYTDDTKAVPLSTWANATSATYDSNTLSVTGSSDIVRVVIPAKTVFPSYKYTSGQIGECVGYYVAGEKVFEKQGETWTDVSREVSKVSGDVNGDKKVNSLDIIAMAKYAKNGYGYNASSLTYDETKTEAGNRHIVRRVILGDVLHNYEKESDNLTYFSSSDLGLDSFLNDFYKRQIGYNDYVEGDMTVNSYKPGTHVDGVYNMGWTTAGLTWLDTANSLESDRLAGQKKILEDVIVDDYNYVWAGKDTVEDPSKNMLTNGAERTMEWPFPNATLTDGGARFWEFHANTSKQDTKLSEWSNNIDATIRDGLYQGTATNVDTVEFMVKDGGFSDTSPIIKTQYAPWLAIDLRMNTADYANIADVYVSFTTSYGSTASYTTVKASEVAALKYAYTENYAHELWFPMYQNINWIGSDGAGESIYQLKIEIIPKSGKTLTGTFALNYVRPSFDTRDSNTNGIYISSLKQYFDYTGDKAFLNANIAKAEKAMDLYMEMYDSSRSLIQQSYFYGHNGKDNLAFGIGNGYWDTLYKPEYDFESNMYFYQALKDLAAMEKILETDTSALESKASAVLTAMRKNVSEGGFYNESTGRFAAGKNYNDAIVDYGYTTWNLQAIELGIATDEQAQSIMSWIDGTRAVAGSNEQTDLYKYEFAPRTATVNDKGIYGWLATNKLQENVYNLGYGNDVQFGGAVMYTSYYDLTSRIQVKDADDALGRLKGIQSWYNDVSTAYKNSSDPKKSVKDFYLPYFKNEDVTMQNGTRGTGNGAVGIDGEFTESLLVAAAIPYGFFGMDSEGGKTLCVTPSLPRTMDHWKVENMQYNGVTYDLSIYKDAVRIDSVRGDATGLQVKVTLDCPEGKDIYVNGVAKKVKTGGKATVTVNFADAIIEVREK